DEEVAVPGDGPVWASLRIDQTLLGRLQALLYRLPPITVELTLADGEHPLFRLVPAIARSGFLLSPLIVDHGGFAALLRRDGPPGHPVGAFSRPRARAE